MKKVFVYHLIVFASLYCSQCFGQNNYAKFKGLIISDSPKIRDIIIKLRAENIDTFLVYQPQIKSGDVTTFLIWKKNNASYAKMITKNFIYDKITVNNKIFLYNYIYKCGVTKSEDDIQFVSPIFTPLRSSFIGFSTPKTTFYFECGLPMTYTPSEQRDVFRKEWLVLIKACANKIEFTSKVKSHYNRIPLHELYKYNYNIFNN